MRYPEDWMLKMTRPIMSLNLDLGDIGTRDVELAVVEMRYGDFQTTVLASTLIKDARVLLGWVGFRSGFGRNMHTLVDVRDQDDLLELRETKIDPQFFGKKVGSKLVEVAHIFAREKGKLLYLKPERPGSGLASEIRDKMFPLDDEEIRDWYLRNGFRKTFATQRSKWSREILDRELTTTLFFAGLDLETGKFKKYRYGYSMSFEDAIVIRISEIPLEQKVQLLIRFHDELGRDGKQIVRDNQTRNASRITKGILIARDDLDLPKRFKPGHRILHAKRQIPESARRANRSIRI